MTFSIDKRQLAGIIDDSQTAEAMAVALREEGRRIALIREEYILAAIVHRPVRQCGTRD